MALNGDGVDNDNDEVVPQLFAQLILAKKFWRVQLSKKKNLEYHIEGVLMDVKCILGSPAEKYWILVVQFLSSGFQSCPAIFQD